MPDKEKIPANKVVMGYFEESYQELRKVSWPTRNQAIRLTFLVLGLCFVSAIVIGAFDFIFMTGDKELNRYANIVNPPVFVTTADETATTNAMPVIDASAASGQPLTVNATDASGNPVSVTATPVSTEKP